MPTPQGYQDEGALGRLGQGSLDDVAARCTKGDWYGERPTAVKIALSVDLKAGAFAFWFQVRMMTFLRLLGMMMSSPEGGIDCGGSKPSYMPCVFSIFKPLFDLFVIQKFEVSFNNMPFPIKLYSGTVIDAGIKLDIENLSFFKLIVVRKCMFRVVPPPNFLLEVQVFIEPFGLEVGGFKILAFHGIGRETRAEAFAAKAEAEKERAAREKLAREQSKLPKPKSPCGEGKCYTCAKADEASEGDLAVKLDIKCMNEGDDGGDPANTMILTNIVDALWANIENRPDWSFETNPGLCKPQPLPTGGIIPTGTPLVITRSGEVIKEKDKSKAKLRVKANREQIIEDIESECLGNAGCIVEVSRDRKSVV